MPAPDGYRWVGLDVHALESTVVVFDQATGEVLTRRVAGRPHELLPVLREVPRPARMVYEAGPTGYGLARRPLAEGFELGVCAPSKTERPAADRIKTLGVFPCEHTTGQQRRLGSITMAGSTHARRLLVEAAYHYRRSPVVGEALEHRQRGHAPDIINVSWKAQHRLHARWRQLKNARRKPNGIIAVAIARELAAYCWEIATCPITTPPPTPTPTTRRGSPTRANPPSHIPLPLARRHPWASPECEHDQPSRTPRTLGLPREPHPHRPLHQPHCGQQPLPD